LGLFRASALAVVVGTFTVIPAFLVGVLSLQIRADLGVSLAQAAAGVTVFFAAGALGTAPLGRLSQRVGALESMRTATVISGLSMLAIAAFASSLEVLLGLLVVAGLANALNQPAINLLMAEEVPLGRQGLAFGVKQSAIPAAILVSGLALPLVALPLGWRATVGICGALALVVAAVAVTAGSSRHPTAHLPVRTTGPPPSRELVLLAVGAGLASFGPAALGAHMVASAVDAGISEAGAGVLVAAASAGSLILRVSLGERADRRADYGFLPVAVLLASGSLGYALIASGEPTPLAIGAVVAFCLGWGWPGLFNLAVVNRHRAAPASATGVTQSGIYVGASAGPALFGLAVTQTSYGTAWAVIAVMALAGAATFFAAGRGLTARAAVR